MIFTITVLLLNISLLIWNIVKGTYIWIPINVAAIGIGLVNLRLNLKNKRATHTDI